MIRKIDLIPSEIKLFFALTFDISALIFSFILAYIIRVGAGNLVLGQAEWSVFITVSLSTMLLFYFSHIYRSVIRYFNAQAAIKIIGLLFISSLIFIASSQFYEANIPRSVPLLFFTIAAALIAGARAIFGVVTGNKWFDEREG